MRLLNSRPTRQTLDDGDSSGRSTPEHLKDIPLHIPVSDDEDEEKSVNVSVKQKNRTFSETLNMLDDDILAELDMK